MPIVIVDVRSMPPKKATKKIFLPIFLMDLAPFWRERLTCASPVRPFAARAQCPRYISNGARGAAGGQGMGWQGTPRPAIADPPRHAGPGPHACPGVIHGRFATRAGAIA